MRVLDDRPPLAEAVHLDAEDPADLVDALEVAAELEEVVDLGPGQGAVDQAVEEDAGRLTPSKNRGGLSANRRLALALPR